jgi:hypothetical protein
VGQFLAGLGLEDPVADLRVERVASWPPLAARLLDEAEDADVLDEVADLRDEFDEAEALIDETPDAVRNLADHLVERIERILDYENCYGDESPAMAPAPASR